MKIGLYSPYWSTLGGGEKYMFDIARCFPAAQVHIFCDDGDIVTKLQERFGKIDFAVTAITNYKKENGKLDYQMIKDYDMFFYQCDGSLFFGQAKKNILLIQSPAHTPRFSWLNKLKSLTWQKIVCNSDFTAHFIKQKMLANPILLNPAILPMSPLPKKKIILAVGRFFPHLHSKKQEVLIEVFQQFCHSLENGDLNLFRLILAGAVADSDKEYLLKLKEQAKGFPVDFYENAPLSKIKELYGEAKIFWHAAGFGEDLIRFPERAEHFGISTVEAISAGCYPLVFKAGGQTEILGDNDQFYWQTKEELLEKTINLISDYRPASSVDGLPTTDYRLLQDIPQKYSFENFKKKLHEILQ